MSYDPQIALPLLLLRRFALLFLVASTVLLSFYGCAVDSDKNNKIPTPPVPQHWYERFTVENTTHKGLLSATERDDSSKVFVHKDTKGRYWFASYSGLTLKDGERWSYFPADLDDIGATRNIAFDASGDSLWFSRFQSLFRVDETGIHEEAYCQKNCAEQGLSGHVTSMAFCGEDFVVISGRSAFTLHEGRWTHENFFGGPVENPYNLIAYLLPSSTGECYAQAQSIFLHKDGTRWSVMGLSLPYQSGAKQWATQLIDRRQRLWFRHRSGDPQKSTRTIGYIDASAVGQAEAVEHPVRTFEESAGSFFTPAEDSSGDIYGLDQSGLYRFAEESDSFTLISAPKTLLGLEGRLWREADGAVYLHTGNIISSTISPVTKDGIKHTTDIRSRVPDALFGAHFVLANGEQWFAEDSRYTRLIGDPLVVKKEDGLLTEPVDLVRDGTTLWVGHDDGITPVEGTTAFDGTKWTPYLLPPAPKDWKHYLKLRELSTYRTAYVNSRYAGTKRSIQVLLSRDGKIVRSNLYDILSPSAVRKGATHLSMSQTTVYPDTQQRVWLGMFVETWGVPGEKSTVSGNRTTVWWNNVLRFISPGPCASNTHFFEDHRGAVWSASFLQNADDGPSLCKLEQGDDPVEDWESVANKHTEALGYPVPVGEDSQGRIWFVGQNGFAHLDGKKWKRFSFELLGASDTGSSAKWLSQAFGGLGIAVPELMLRNIHEDASGALWFATAWGLSRYEEGEWSSFNVKGAKFTNFSVSDVEEDTPGVLWLATSEGLLRAKAKDIPMLPLDEGD